MKTLSEVLCVVSQQLKENILCVSSQCVFLITSAVVLSVGPIYQADAATFSVPCDSIQLADAINVANSDIGADTLNLTPNCDYVYVFPETGLNSSSSLPTITSPITINGNLATIRLISAGTTFENKRVSILDIGMDAELKLTELRNRARGLLSLNLILLTISSRGSSGKQVPVLRSRGIVR